MKDCIYIEPFDIDGFGRFKGGYLFKDENEDNGFLLNSENGCSIILSAELCDQVVSQDINEALVDFEAELGDQISGSAGFTEFDDEWLGDIETLVPGQGYLYYSASDEVKTLVFKTGAKSKKGKQ